MLHIQLLGPLLVCDDDHDLTPPGPRERNALAALATVSPEALSTERLALELYRERATADPRNAVQAVISRLRRALGRSAGSIETTATGYRLVDVTLDVDEVERRFEGASAEVDLDRAAALLAEAVTMWRGPTLDGLTGELVDAERLRIDDLRADAEDALFQRRSANGEHAVLVAELETAVRQHPLREKRWELLMLSLYRDGRQADALRAFQRARSMLADHLGLEPGPALNQLEQRILGHDPTLDPAVDGAAVDDPGPSPAAAPLPAGTVTVVMCDVEGSVRRWEAAPDDTDHAIAELHRIWTETTEASGGHLVKSTGDGVLAVFETAGAAVGAAVDALTTRTDGALSVRVAINTGSLEPVAADPVDHHGRGGDYRGLTVNRCARLLDLAHGGQILLSATTADLARAELGLPRTDPPLSARDLGVHWLRDVPDPMQVWQVEGAGLRSSFPPLRSSGPTSLPRRRTGLLGRSELVDEVAERCGHEALVTLLGPGGIGKTSVSLAVAWRLVEGRPVTFIDLARITDPAAVALHMADAVATDHDADGDPRQRLADRLRVGTDLVVVDNAEHVLDSVAATLDQVLSNELKGSFLVTSRQPLGLVDETIVAVPPLALPGDDDDLDATGRSPSVRLFLDRVRTAKPDAELPHGLLPVVAHICRRLDGIPLAIELAAGRASLLAIDDIAARLDDQLRLLRQVRSSRDRRHRSLEAVVTWSVDQLSAPARETFDRLSVMAGGFGIEAVEQVLARCAIPGEPIDALGALDELYEASLLSVEPEGSRFRMLEPIRQVAAAELAARGLDDETKSAQAHWLIDLLTDAHRRRDQTRAPAFAVIDRESDQLRAAITWIADADQVDLAAEAAIPASWWFLTRDARAGARLLRRLVPLADRTVDRLGWAKTVIGVGVVTASHPLWDLADVLLDAVAVLDEHDHPDAGLARLAAAYALPPGPDITVHLRLLDEAATLIPSDDRLGTALVDMATMTLHGLLIAHNRRELDSASPDVEHYIARGERAADTFRQLGETWSLGVTLGELGRTHQMLGALDRAEACYIESLDLFDRSDYHGSHYVMTELGKLASTRGDHDKADRYHREAFRIAELDGNAGCLALSWGGLGHAAEARGEAEHAADSYRQALALADGASLLEHEAPQWRQALLRLDNAE